MRMYCLNGFSISGYIHRKKICRKFRLRTSFIDQFFHPVEEEDIGYGGLSLLRLY